MGLKGRSGGRPLRTKPQTHASRPMDLRFQGTLIDPTPPPVSLQSHETKKVRPTMAHFDSKTKGLQASVPDLAEELKDLPESVAELPEQPEQRSRKQRRSRKREYPRRRNVADRRHLQSAAIGRHRTRNA